LASQQLTRWRRVSLAWPRNVASDAVTNLLSTNQYGSSALSNMAVIVRHVPLRLMVAVARGMALAP